MLTHKIPFVLSTIVTGVVSTTALAGEVYCVQPVYEIENESRADEEVRVPNLATDAPTETDACNLLVNLVGTRADHDIRGRFCKKGHGCTARVFRKPMIRGGRIGVAKDISCAKPEFISQVNELHYPSDKALRLCDVSVSWDPANARNREIAYHEYYVSVGGGGVAHVRAGDKNPNYRPPASHQK